MTVSNAATKSTVLWAAPVTIGKAQDAKKQIHEFPASVARDWSFSAAKQAITAQQQGNFAPTTVLARSMMSDSRYKPVLDKRILGLVKALVKVTAVNADNPLEVEAAKLVQDNLQRLLPEVELIKWMTWYHNLSIAPATLDWCYYDSIWVPELRVLNPEHTYYYVTDESWYHNTKDGRTPLTFGDGRWVLMSSWQQGMPSGFVSSLGLEWISKQYAKQSKEEWLEVHASPILKAITPPEATQEVRNQFVQAVAAARNTKVIECQQNPDGSGWDVQLVVGRQDGADIYLKSIEYSDTQITIAVLGANLATEVVAVGAKAASETHLGVQRELIKADATVLSTVFREQVIRPFIQVNLGDVEPPWCQWLIPGDDVTDADLDAEVNQQQATNDSAPTPNLEEKQDPAPSATF